MWKNFGVKCVNWGTFCILDEYPQAGVDALSTDTCSSILATAISPFGFVGGRRVLKGQS